MTATSFGHRLVGTFAIELVCGILRLAVPLVLARVIGVQAYGLYVTATGLTALVFSWATSGVPLAATYYAAICPGRSTTSRLLACSGALALVGSFLSAPFGLLYQRAALTEVPPWVIALVLAAAIPYGVELTALGVLRGQARVVAASGLGLLRQLTILCSAAALSIWGGGFEDAVIAFVATGVVVTVLAMRVALRSAPDSTVPPRYVQIIKYAGHVQASTTLTFLNYRIGLFILAATVSPTELGIYAAAISMAEATWFFSHTVSSVLAGQVAAATNGREASKLTERACRMVTGASLLSVLTLASISPWLMSAFGADFHQGWDVLVASLVAAFLLAPSRVLATHRAALGSPVANIRGTALGVFANVVLTAALTPRLGALGAALANALGYAIVASDRVLAFVRGEAGAPPTRVRDLLLPNASDWRAMAGSAHDFLARFGR